ncbi:MAG: DUF2461 domain-containing protein [Oscillospiraceae bacterium]|nr:DUF2461 domain-containing protein [Oscillospiraceae bacterium]
MFQGFTEKTGGFLWELAFNNERPWFLAHKQEFEDVVNTPFKAMAAETFEQLNARCPDFEGRLHVSRIYRDARRLFGRGPYKDHMWFSIKASDVLLEGPMFWFEVGPSEYSFGCGFYSATPVQMDAFRRSIDANPARFLRLAKAAERDGWELDGPGYTRPKGSFDDPLLNAWYNRKRVGLSKSFDWGEAGYSPALPQTVVDGYIQLMDMYKYFMEVYLSCPGEMTRSH